MNTKNPLSSPFLYQDFCDATNALLDGIAASECYMLLLGESGCGKTTLLRHIRGYLDTHEYSVIYLGYGKPSPVGLSRILAEALHLPIRHTHVETARLVVETLKHRSMRVLVWIDDAVGMRDDTLLELRMLAEADLCGTPLFSVILSATPEFKERLLAPQLISFWRRVTTCVKLRGLVHEEIAPFLNHTLGEKTAHRFSDEALSVIFEKTHGIPASIAVWCRRCLKHMPGKEKLQKQHIIDMLDFLELF